MRKIMNSCIITSCNQVLIRGGGGSSGGCGKPKGKEKEEESK